MQGRTEAGFDVVVVGAGSAGCVITRRLVDAGLSVALVEAGPPDSNPDIHDPAGMFAVYNSPEDWAFTTVPQAACFGRQVECPRGRVLGGSSAINAMIFARGSRHDYDSWAYCGNPGWAYEDVLPLFRRLEDFDRGESEYHGAGGPLHVLSDYAPREVLEAIVDASVEYGIPRNEDHNGETLGGAGFIQFTIKEGRRQSSAVAFLRDVLDRPNLTVFTDTLARRLLFEGGRCTGVECSRAGADLKLHAGGEVVVSSGAIGSPQLLMLSGIGAAAELAAVGVEVRHDLPGVGKNLQDHLLCHVVQEAAEPIPMFGSGDTPHQVQVFSESRPGLLGPDLQMMCVSIATPPPDPMPAPDGTFPAPADLAGRDAFSMLPILARPASRGNVVLRSADPTDAPLIDPRYLTCDADVATLVAGIEQAREIIAEEALAPWRGPELFPGPTVGSEAELREYVRRTANTVYHHAGTCRMGNGEDAVVDPRLRVHGVDGLRVADASIMPTLTSANTNAPSMMIGERAADLILGEPLSDR